MVIRAIGVVYMHGAEHSLAWWATLFWAAAIALKIIETTAHRASAEERNERLLLGGKMGEWLKDRFFAWWDGYYELARGAPGDF